MANIPVMDSQQSTTSFAGAILLFVAVGCGNVNEHPPGDASTTIDSVTIDSVTIDSATIDSPAPREVTLSQALSMDVTDGLACENAMRVRENSFYRAFKLSDYAIAGALHLKMVTFGVYLATAGMSAGRQSVQIRIYTHAGVPDPSFLDTTKMSPVTVAGRDIDVLDSASPTVIDHAVSADIPAGTSAIVAELFVNDGVAAESRLLFGANTQGDRAPAYHRAVCNPTAKPTAFTVHDTFEPYALVLSLTGDTGG
jgi:hypothetical protein